MLNASLCTVCGEVPLRSSCVRRQCEAVPGGVLGAYRHDAPVVRIQSVMPESSGYVRAGGYQAGDSILW
jgi:hypothetical protein